MISSTTSSKQQPNISSKRGTKKGGGINYLDVIVFGSVLFVAIFLISCSLILHGLNAASSSTTSTSTSNSVESTTTTTTTTKAIVDGGSSIIDNNDELSNINSDQNNNNGNAIQQKIDNIGGGNKKLNVRKAAVTTNNNEEQLILKTDLGIIKIKFLPNLSADSVEYIKLIAKSGKCSPCKFHRAEKHLLLQGTMKNNEISETKKPKKGNCPPEYTDKKQSCPEYDPNCSCHGPTMTKGMVGWAGGMTGPDFFINVFEKPVDFWGQQHTVWGIVEDVQSLRLVEKTFLEDLPVHKGGNVWKLDEEIYFTMSLSSSSTTKATATKT